MSARWKLDGLLGADVQSALRHFFYPLAGVAVVAAADYLYAWSTGTGGEMSWAGLKLAVSGAVLAFAGRLVKRLTMHLTPPPE